MRFARLLIIGAIVAAVSAPAVAAIPKVCTRGPALSGSCTFKYVGAPLRINVESVGGALLFAPRTITCLYPFNPYYCLEANAPEGVGLTRVEVRMTTETGDSIFTCTTTTTRVCTKKNVSFQWGAHLTCTMYVQRARSIHPGGSAVQIVPTSGTFACSSGG